MKSAMLAETDNTKVISTLSDSETLSLFASLAKLSNDCLNDSNGPGAGIYLRVLNKVVRLRNLVPAQIDDIDPDSDVVWFSADTDASTGDNAGREISKLSSQDAAAFIAHLVTEGYGSLESDEGYRAGYYIKKTQQVLTCMKAGPVEIEDVDPDNDRVWFKEA